MQTDYRKPAPETAPEPEEEIELKPVSWLTITAEWLKFDLEFIKHYDCFFKADLIKEQISIQISHIVSISCKSDTMEFLLTGNLNLTITFWGLTLADLRDCMERKKYLKFNIQIGKAPCWTNRNDIPQETT